MIRKHHSTHSLIVISLLLSILISGIASAECNETIPQEIINFLEIDTTDENEYLQWYTWGHFTRSLAHNASEYNISMGAAILSNHPTFRGHHNHIINYIEIENVLYFIEPQTDNIMLIDGVFMLYQYIRLYPDCTQVPSNWRYNLAPSLIIDEAEYEWNS